MDEVLFSRADVALNDIPTVVQYVRAHPDRVKALWVDNPPSWVAASFVTRREDVQLLTFLNTALRIIKVDGTLSKIDEKWQALGYLDKPTLVPGAGLKTTSGQ
jgi:ABC-type amino acid transport substrate-binding protein